MFHPEYPERQHLRLKNSAFDTSEGDIYYGTMRLAKPSSDNNRTEGYIKSLTIK